MEEHSAELRDVVIVCVNAVVDAEGGRQCVCGGRIVEGMLIFRINFARSSQTSAELLIKTIVRRRKLAITTVTERGGICTRITVKGIFYSRDIPLSQFF